MDILDSYQGNSHALHTFPIAFFDQRNHCSGQSPNVMLVKNTSYKGHPRLVINFVLLTLNFVLPHCLQEK
jgi:hypothetical protein